MKSIKQLNIEKEYKRTRKNLLAKKRKAEKRGYIFNDDIIPKIPKRITQASINRLNKLSGNLYNKASYVSAETYGEIVFGKKGRQIEKSRSAKKSAQTRKAKQQKEIIEDIGKKAQLDKESINPPIVEETKRKRSKREQQPIKPTISEPLEVEESEETDFNALNVAIDQDDFYSYSVMYGFYESLKTSLGDRSRLIVTNFIDRMIGRYPIEAIAKMLEESAQAGLKIEVKDLYKGQLVEKIEQMLGYLQETFEEGLSDWEIENILMEVQEDVHDVYIL